MPGPRRPPRDRGTSNARLQDQPPTSQEDPQGSTSGGGGGGGGGGDKVWTLSGRLRVRESEITGTSTLRDLVGVEVEVCASDIGADGPWTDWGHPRTDESGQWSLSYTKNGKNRFFRVRMRLRSSDLEVNDSDVRDLANLDLLDLNWRTVWKSEEQLEGPRIDVGTRVFSSGNPYELGDETWRRQALIWYAVRTAMDRLVQEDAWFKFNGKIAVIYPAHTAGGTSYANGLTRMAYLEVGGDDVDWHPDVALHEVMHLWNYDHNVGTSNWLAAVCSLRGENPIDLDTHATQENPNIAFHEGFAEWASQALLNELWGLRKARPYNRRWLYARRELTTLDMVEKNDDAVTHGLHLLQAKGKLGWWQYLFGTAETWPEGRDEDHAAEVGTLDAVAIGGTSGLTMWKILRTFRASPEHGWDTDWQVGNSTYGLLRFIDRAVDIHELGEDLRVNLKRWLDPLATDEPRDAVGPVPRRVP